jgi:hypothetical protein
VLLHSDRKATTESTGLDDPAGTPRVGGIVDSFVPGPRASSPWASAVSGRTRRACRRDTLLCLTLCLLGPAFGACGNASSDASAVGSAPTALPANGDLDTRCTDGNGDTAGIDLSSVALVSQDDQLVVAFAFSSGVPNHGAAILTIQAGSQDGSASHQLGIQLLEGKPAASFVATSPTSSPTRLYDAVHVADGQVHAAFPAAAVTDLGPKWNWFAMAGGVDAVDDFCPGGAGTTLNTVTAVAVP